MDRFARLDAMDQADLVRQGDVKPIELVDAAIERIERVNGRLNAVVTPLYERARKAANGTLPAGPFTGARFGCGNGFVESGEACDDGNVINGDCCSSTCAFEPSGSPCTDDGRTCTVDQCNAAGICTHTGSCGCQ